MEPYLTRLTEVNRKFITKLRVNNIKFPIKTGRWRIEKIEFVKNVL